MKKASFILIMVCFAILITGCTGTNAPDPIIGTWRDTLLGVTQMGFTENHQYQANTLDVTYSGNWTKLSTNRYEATYFRTNNNTYVYSAIIDYDPINKTIYLESAPDILYARITDRIQGNWTDQQRVSLIQLNSDYSYKFEMNNTSYYGNWSKINDTNYMVEYSEPSNMSIRYNELLVYNQSNDILQIDNIPYVYYTRL